MFRCGWVVGALIALQPGLAHADLFLLVDGVAGGVTTPPWTGWHQARSYSISLDRSNSALPFQLQVVLQRHAVSVAAIQQAAFTGASLKRIVIDNAAPLTAANAMQTFTRLTCDDVVIRTFSSSGNEGQAAVFQLELVCGKLQWEEFDYNNAGAVVKASKGSWNFRTNTP